MRLCLIPDALKRKRLENAWDQPELAKRAGISPSTISLLESGLRKSRVRTIRKLARVLGCEPLDIAEIVEDVDEVDEVEAAAQG